MEGNQHLGGAWIPPWIFRDENLSPPLKLTLGRIVSLSNKHGYCWATDGWLAEDMNINRRTLQRRLRQLDDKGYIEREKDENGDTTSRKLAPTRKTLRTHTTDPSYGGGGHTTDPSYAYSSEDTVSSEDTSKNNVEEETDWEDMSRLQRLKRSTPSDPAPEIRRVFTYARERRASVLDIDGGPPLQLSDKRHNKIRARLEEGFTVEQLRAAYAGLTMSDYHVENQYLDPELCFRDDEKVRRNMSLYKKEQEEDRGNGLEHWG